MIIDEDDYLAHYGVLRKSGRYPWGSGDDPNGAGRVFLDTVHDMRRQGLSDVDIAKGFGISTTDLRALNSIAKNEQKVAQIHMAEGLKAKQMSNVAIGERMGIPESTVRTLLAPGAKERADVLMTTKNMLKREVGEKNYIDIGTNVENQLQISKDKLRTAVLALEQDGYKVQYLKIPTNLGQFTTMKVLTKADVTYSELYKNRDQVRQIQEYSNDGGRSTLGVKTPLSVDSRRLKVRYAEEGGTQADGVIYVRPGVKDVSLDGKAYAQVRIMVDGSHFIKGMAVYKNDLPPGVDLEFNTSKSSTGNKLDALKELKRNDDGTLDEGNPFGAVLKRQITEKDHDGNDKVTSAMNIVNEQGDWEKWSRTLSSQFLSKQSPALAKQQLQLTQDVRKQDLEDILRLTNPVVKKKLLESYADDADSAAVHLKAKSLPGQASHVILPVSKIKENEIYAPNYENGTRVALVRFPHGGKFEIPELVVNNNNRESKALIGRATDAVGIHHKVAERLSGADFDGDTVLVIPNNKRQVQSAAPLEGLRNFDAKARYRLPDDSPIPRMSKSDTQMEMGKITNLIADMTIRKASNDEIARAVKHSMVVIDAEKHGLNYKQSERDNGILSLKRKYQFVEDKKSLGASTLITRASSEKRVLERKARRASEGGPIDRETGKLVYEPTGRKIVNKKGKEIDSTTKSTKLAETDDAHSLSSGTPIEKIYADHSNSLKALANKARLEAVNTKPPRISESAKKTYALEVQSLNAKLNLALKNAPRERQAQLIKNATVSAYRRANPDMDKADLKKIQSQALIEARMRTGASKKRIEITQEEWNAIQAGAISAHKLSQILSNTDLDAVKKFATPRDAPVMTGARLTRANRMLDLGHTPAEVATALGISVSTLKSAIRTEESS